MIVLKSHLVARSGCGLVTNVFFQPVGCAESALGPRRKNLAGLNPGTLSTRSVLK
jgi:hypothetical protein